MADLSCVPNSEREHPAYTSFVVALADLRMAPKAVVQAWQWHKHGWIAHQTAMIDAVDAEEGSEAQPDEELLTPKRPSKPALSHDCDECDADVGEPCRSDRSPAQPPMNRVHSKRAARARNTRTEV